MNRVPWRNGQIAVLLAFALAAVAMLALMNVDTFLAVRTRWRVQNAGDAAALAAARHQGDVLNRIGALNIAHVAAALANDTNECRRIVELQRRIALLDPIDGIRLANAAAVKNGVPCSRDNMFATLLRLHAKAVRDAGTYGGDGAEVYPEPFEGAWEEYASKIEAACAGELAIGVDNIAFFGMNQNHILLQPAFYEAVLSRNWCWFHLQCPQKGLLDTYENYKSWPPLPVADSPESMQNSEVFSIGVAARKRALLSVVTPGTLIFALSRYGGGAGADEKKIMECPLLSDPGEEWFFFTDKWHKWFNGMRLVGLDKIGDFPLAGDIKREYNVAGADAAVRCQLTCERTTAGPCPYIWTAAAKPFGFLETSEGSRVPATAAGFFVLPCFTDVRLVPYDSVVGGCTCTANHDWILHVQVHLPPYLSDGKTHYGCRYCQALRKWDNSVFRASGRRWLKFNAHRCTIENSYIGGAGGGLSCGH